MRACKLSPRKPKRQRRWFQFSLRTLLIGVTLVAVACCGIVDRARLIRERDEALQREATAEKRASVEHHISDEMQELAENKAREAQSYRLKLKALGSTPAADSAAQP
jgi:hypothetical protein